MSKIPLIIEREFLTRVRKKSFIITTLITPILFAALMIVPALIASMEDTTQRTIAVIDESGLFSNRIPETENLKFVYLEGVKVSDMQSTFRDAGYYAVLFIGHVVAQSPDGVILFSDVQPPIDVTQHIASSLKNELETQKLRSYNIENLEEILASIDTPVRVRTIKWTNEGEAKEGSTELAMGMAYILSFMIYMLIFLFGTQVMRGVVEEKTNRIVEVIISSVRPFELMMGKILGIASVGLVQISLWILLTIGLVTGAKTLFVQSQLEPTQPAITNLMDQTGANQMVVPPPAVDGFASEIMVALSNMNLVFILGWFIFYFLGGYLLYAAMFAAVGSAVDNDTDSQQMVTPITIPLILALVVMISGIRSPDGDISFWFSIIPFTSPIIMTTRLPYGVPGWELALSASLLVVTFIFITWLAGRIYRTGILLYGRKNSWAQMWKWLRSN